MGFSELAESFGGDQLVPNDVLYGWLQEHREDLVAQMQLGVDHVPNSKLGKEVRRRCQEDLCWLAIYMLWETNPYSEGGTLPISESRITEESHGVILKQFFIAKDPSKKILEQDTKIKNRIILWPRGGLKALDVNTHVATPNGFIRMGDIQTGDLVLGVNGRPTRVIGVSPVYNERPCYEVEFSTGEVIVADEGHLWETDTRKARENKRVGGRGTPSPSVKTTKEIADTLRIRGEANHRVRVAQTLHLPVKDYSISPYVLGCWLGDGTSSCGHITIGESDAELADNIASEGEVLRKSSSLLRWVFNGGVGHPDYKKKGTSFAARLRKLNLLDNKHVPQEYLRGSREQRLALLQGLMDTDGTVDKRGHCVFYNTNRNLVESARELVCSLGMKCGAVYEGPAMLNGVEVGRVCSIKFYACDDVPVFRLKRKRDRQLARKKTTLQNYRQVIDVRPVASRPVKCITVDSEDRLYLVGRSFIPTHNTTIDLCDVVQWVLCFPFIRIWLLTAADDLATALLEEFKGHFVLKPDAPTFLNIFFPEFSATEKEIGNEFEFWCPVFTSKKLKRKEPTVYASSLGSTASGFHWDLIKGDDVVSDRNSESEDQCRKVTKSFQLRKKTLVRGGYVDLVGTRYGNSDLYGTALEQSSIGEVVENRGQNWVMRDNLGTSTRILVAKAIQIKPEVLARMEKDGVDPTFSNAGEDGCTLLLPAYMGHGDLCRQHAENELIFAGQMLQEPRPESDQTFDRPTLLKHTLPVQSMPQRGPISQTWDFSFSSKKGRDYCTGSSVMWGDKGAMYVHDLIRDRFKPDALAKAVVDFAAKWRPQSIGIENAAGSNLLEPTIMREAYKTGIAEVIDVCRRIDWFAPDNQKDAKRVRMAALQPWLVNDMLWFAAYLPHLETLYNEFELCLVDHHHDDIPDVIAQHPRYQPAMTIARQEIPLQNLPSIDPAYNILYGAWLTESEAPADAFGRLGMGQPITMFEQMMAQEPEHYIEAETPMHGIPSILGGGLCG